MSKHLTVLGAFVACTFGCLASSAQAGPLVTNGSFEQTTLGTKGSFLNNVFGWSGGSKLTFLDFPGTASTTYLAVYPGLPATSPNGGNFVEMDGDPNYSSAISQTLSGLTIGNSYMVNFYQAAGQQNGFKGPTTELWQVGFGNDMQKSSKYSLKQGETGNWGYQTMTFTAKAVTELLSFLAVGTPTGAPPISFLDGVSVVDATAVPEASSWAIFGAGLAALVGIVTFRQRRFA
jgi:hypothetical protein